MTDIQFKPGDAVQLRNGWEAEVLDVVEGQYWCVFIKYKDEEGEWHLRALDCRGRECSVETDYDLIHKPKRMSGFVNVYDDGPPVTFFSNRHVADWTASKHSRNRIACIDLSQLEEGEGL